MRGAIVGYAVVALAVLVGVDRVWPVWPVHAVMGLLAVVVVALAGLAIVASGRRVGQPSAPHRS